MDSEESWDAFSETVADLSGTVENEEYEYFDDEFDYEFLVEGHAVPARKRVLSALSTVLRSEFESNEITLGRNVITDIRLGVFQKFIEILHTGYADVEPSMCVELMRVAGRYKVEELCEACEIEMGSSLNECNAAYYLTVAIKAERTNLIDKIIDFIKQRTPYIFEEKAWKHFSRDVEIMSSIIESFWCRAPSKNVRVQRPSTPTRTTPCTGVFTSLIPQSPLLDNRRASCIADIVSNHLIWGENEITWSLTKKSLLCKNELTSDVFFVSSSSESSSMNGYKFVYQLHDCVQCYTTFTIAVCRTKPGNSEKLRGSVTGNFASLTMGCGRCVSYTPPSPARKLTRGTNGVEIVEFGRFQGLTQNFFAGITFTLKLNEGTRNLINPLCQIIVRGHSFQCNSGILARGSPYFAQLLQSNSKTVYHINDVTPEDFSVVYCYLTNELLVSPAKINLAVLQMAGEFEIQRLFEFCEDVLAKRVDETLDLAIKYFVIGHQTGATTLKESAKNTIKCNFRSIWFDNPDREYFQTAPELLFELLKEFAEN